jgi:hypothetical protein
MSVEICGYDIKGGNGQAIAENTSYSNLQVQGLFPNFGIITNWNDWRDWRVSIDYLESLTGYNFLSELPEDIQEAIESEDNGLLLVAAPLLADMHPSSTSSFLKYVSENISFRHDNITQVADAQAIPVQESSFEVAVVKGSFAQGNSAEVSTFKIDGVHTNFNEVGSLKVNSLENGIPNSSTILFGSSKIGIIHLNLIQKDIEHISSTKVGVTHINTSQIGSVQISTTKDNATQINSLQTSTSEADSSKISLSSSITLQQLLNSYPHLFSLASNNTYKDNLPTLWKTLFDSTNPFGLTLQITDLPTGQLAVHEVW